MSLCQFNLLTNIQLTVQRSAFPFGGCTGFISGCAWSLLQAQELLSCEERRLLLGVLIAASPCCRARARGRLGCGAPTCGLRAAGVLEAVGAGLAAPRCVKSSRTRDWTRVPWIGRQVVIYCTTREVQWFFKIKVLN